MWCIPPQQDARFVAAMEDVLEVYARPYNAQRPVICLDEAAKQILAEVREPLPLSTKHGIRYDSEYERCGTCAVFMVFEPLGAKRFVQVRQRRTAVDYAQVVKWMCDELYPDNPDTEKIVLVQDNLNTHKPASLYEAFPAEEARRLVERFEWHYTPKHGSWLDMAESELRVLSTQCLDRRIADKHTLTEQVAAWEASRNKKHAKADWQFTTADARIKRKRLYSAL
jgi:hypothetical protein